MRLATILARFEEFAFLGRYADPYEVKSVFVRLVDYKLAETIPSTPETAEYGDSPRRFFLIDNEGEEICEVPRTHLGELTLGKILTLRWRRPVIRGKSVLDAAVRNRAITKVRFIADIDDQDCDRHVRVHRIPKDFNLHSWLRETVRQEREGLRTEIERADFGGAVDLEFDLAVYQLGVLVEEITIGPYRFRSPSEAARAALDLVQPGLKVGAGLLVALGDPEVGIPAVKGGYGPDTKLVVTAVRAVL